MPFDIYGQPLQTGHCEVHPGVWGEYPCSLCIQETQQASDMRDHEVSMREQYDEGMKQLANDEWQGVGGDKGEIARLSGEIARLRQWQQTPEGPNCSGVEQLNRIVAGLVREYGDNGVLTLSNAFANEVPLGQQVKWGCTGEASDFIVIREASAAKASA